jgi:hypothetical protein
VSTKRWEKPELIVLIRSNPEESILDVCKGGAIGSGPKMDFNMCRSLFWYPGCGNCQGNVDS